MFYPWLKYWKARKPKILGAWVRLTHSGSRIRIGKGFQCDSIPHLTVDKNAQLVIGDNVTFRRDVEIRAHQHGKVLIGNRVRLDRGIRLLTTNRARLVLKDGVRVGLYSVFNGGDNIFVGEKTLISGFVYLQTSMHRFQGEGNIQEQGYDHADIVLKEDVWLGTHAVIFPGVTLEKGCVVGSNAVVRNSFPENSIVGGVPAKLLKER